VKPKLRLVLSEEKPSQTERELEMPLEVDFMAATS
jgi:hypothetical protein